MVLHNKKHASKSGHQGLGSTKEKSHSEIHDRLGLPFSEVKRHVINKGLFIEHIFLLCVVQLDLEPSYKLMTNVEEKETIGNESSLNHVFEKVLVLNEVFAKKFWPTSDLRLI
jgi:hypothetical protein